MPEDSKKSHDKKKGDPKEQRRPRQKHQQSGAEKKLEKKSEEPKNAPKGNEMHHTDISVTAPQKPVYESPPPEFYKNLKRETDDILKITEGENTKYKKKEIQSNWSKYEMPIDSYEEIEEQDLGADYEKLIQAPLSIGGHFQFKHEKSWDMNTGPSLYDKYFEINMEDLNVALCSIPFYKRNSIGETNFSQTDILTMNNRSTRFKQKYYNDKSYSTPEIEAQDKILSNLRETMKEDISEKEKDTSNDIEIKCDNDHKCMRETEKTPALTTDIDLEFKTEIKTEAAFNKTIEENVSKHAALLNKTELIQKPNIDEETENNEHEDFVFGDTGRPTKEPEVERIETPSSAEKPTVCHTEKTPVLDTKATPLVASKVSPTAPSVRPTIPKVDPTPVATKVADTPVETMKIPTIESPEDLEKWLDDFLDG